MGRYLDLAKKIITVPSPCPTEAPTAATTEEKPPTPEAPAGAVLLAPRYAGAGKPLAAIPECWCCHTPYRLERLQEWQGRTYAWLEPGCACLDLPQALACCGRCTEHCGCGAEREKALAERLQ